MRKPISFVVALAAFALLTPETEAKTVKISGRHSESEIRATCDKVGGSFNSSPSGGTYGCTKACGNPSQGPARCSVDCKDNGKCTGTTPGRTAPKTPTVLQMLTLPRGGAVLEQPSAQPGTKGGDRVPPRGGTATDPKSPPRGRAGTRAPVGGVIQQPLKGPSGPILKGGGQR